MFFVAKYDSAGVVQWAKRGGGTQQDRGNGIGVDASGNCYVTGFFEGSAMFEGAALTSAGQNDAFLLKYDSSGVLQWAKELGATSSGQGHGIAVGGDAVYLTGDFYGRLVVGGNTLKSPTAFGQFLAKFNIAGVPQWGADGHFNGAGWSAAVDVAGNCYVAWGTSAVAKFSDSGSREWTQSIGGGDAHSIAVDAAGNCCVGGSFWGGITIGATTLTSAGGPDAFLVKLNSFGIPQWAYSIGSPEYEGTGRVALDRFGNAFWAGGFQGTVNFAGLRVSTTNGYDLFLAKRPLRPPGITAQLAGSSTSRTGSRQHIHSPGSMPLMAQMSQ